MAKRRKIFLVGFLADEKISDPILKRYVQRSLKHYHEEGDEEATFSGVDPLTRIAVIDVERDTINRNVQEMVDFFNVMDRMQGKE